MAQRVLVDLENHVAHVRLNRPDKRNGLDLPMFEALLEAGLALSEERGLRAVVLSGEGPSFCAGLDVNSVFAFGLEQAMEQLLAPQEGSPANTAQRAAWIWRELPVPVIAALHGATLGGGLQLALACDLRFAGPDVRLSVMEIAWGLVPDMTLSRTLPRLVGLDVAKELTFTGRSVNGEEAHRLGLVTRLCEQPVHDALRTAHEIAARNPDAIRAGKRLLDASADQDDAAGLAEEELLQRAILGSANQLEAVMARMQERAPEFEDPE